VAEGGNTLTEIKLQREDLGHQKSVGKNSIRQLSLLGVTTGVWGLVLFGAVRVDVRQFNERGGNLQETGVLRDLRD